jgi:hypothetical protein
MKTNIKRRYHPIYLSTSNYTMFLAYCKLNNKVIGKEAASILRQFIANQPKYYGN